MVIVSRSHDVDYCASTQGVGESSLLSLVSGVVDFFTSPTTYFSTLPASLHCILLPFTAAQEVEESRTSQSHRCHSRALQGNERQEANGKSKVSSGKGERVERRRCSCLEGSEGWTCADAR